MLGNIRFVSLLLLLTPFLNAEIVITKQEHGLLLNTEYGAFEIQEKVLIDLIECPAMERLKQVSQYGVVRYARNKDDFSRFEHSIGVFALLRRFNARLEEQVAGLLHDASHTVFSHVGDLVFNHYFNRYSYQDDIHEWFLEKSGVATILKQHGFPACCSDHAKKSMRMLEQDKPNLCVDRIEYIMRGGLCEGILTQQDVNHILENLYFENGLWVCADIKTAQAIGRTALALSENIFGSAWNIFIYKHAAQALIRALEIQALTIDDIHFSTDAHVWQTLKSSTDAQIASCIDKVEHHADYFTVGDVCNHTTHYNVKFLGVNPWVETDGGIERLATVDASFAQEYERVQQQAQQGWYLIEK
jgi:HD superfamily phosphohydrolase